MRRRMGAGRGGREEKLIELGKNNYFLNFGGGMMASHFL